MANCQLSDGIKGETPDWTIWQDVISCVNSSFGWEMPGEIINNACDIHLRLTDCSWGFPFISYPKVSCQTLIKSSIRLCKWTDYIFT